MQIARKRPVRIINGLITIVCGILGLSSTHDHRISLIDKKVKEINNKTKSFDTIKAYFVDDEFLHYDTCRNIVRLTCWGGDCFVESYYLEKNRLFKIITTSCNENYDSTIYYFTGNGILLKNEEINHIYCTDTGSVLRTVKREYYYSDDLVIGKIVSGKDTAGCYIPRYTIYGAWPDAKILWETYKSGFNDSVKIHWQIEMERKVDQVIRDPGI